VKILYVSQYYPPEMGAPSARASELGKHWVSMGHQPTVLTGFPNHPTGRVPPEWRSRFRRLRFREAVDGVNITRTWLLPLPNRKSIERALNYSSFCLSACLTGSTMPKPDVVIGTSPQLLVGLSAWWIARLKRVPFIFEVRDLWPESLVAVGAGGASSLLHRVLGRIAGFLYRHSDHIVVVTPAFKDYLIKNWSVPEEKISIVENGVETDLFRPESCVENSELGASQKFRVCYIGTLGWAHGLDTLVQAAAELQSCAPEVDFLLVGEGADKDRIKALAHEQGLSNISFIDQVPRERIPKIIQQSDICLVLLRKTDVFKTVIPTKMLEYMSCSRPVLLGVDGQARSILEEAGGGVYVEPENANALANAILDLRTHPELCEQFGKNNRRYILAKFSRQKTAERYIEVLERFVGHPQQDQTPVLTS
jgi:colanic acid biosynthesis glycosyl transferase WcaI